MNCETCDHIITETDLHPKIGGGDGDSIEVKFQCPECKQGYYVFVQLDSFVVDPAVPGKPQEDEA